jgi:hypothetical protein
MHHSFYTVAFADVGNRFGPGDLDHWKYQDFPANFRDERPVGKRRVPIAWTAPKPGVECWRPIAVDVTAGGVGAWWADQLFGEGALDKLGDERGQLLQGLVAAPSPFPVRGSLGLLVYRSRACFKHVVLRPLP